MKQFLNLPAILVLIGVGLVGSHLIRDADVPDLEVRDEIETSYESELDSTAENISDSSSVEESLEASTVEASNALSEQLPSKKVIVKESSSVSESQQTSVAERIEKMLDQVQLDFNEGRFQQVIYAMRQALQLDPGHVEAEEALAAALFELGDFAEAEKTYKSIIDKEPHNLAAIEQLAESFEARGMTQEAIQYLSDHIEKTPNALAASAILGSILSVKKDSAAAAEILSDVYKKVKGPKGALVHQLGGAYLEGGAPDKAAQLFRNYMVEIEKMMMDKKMGEEQRNQLKDERIDMQEKLAYAYLKQNDCAGAAATLQNLRKHESLESDYPIVQTFSKKCEQAL